MLQVGWKEGDGRGLWRDGLREGSHVTGLARLVGALHGAMLSLEIVSTKDSSPLSVPHATLPSPVVPLWTQHC